MYTLGLNAAFHDSAACLVLDGQVVAAAEEERFMGVKHAKRPIPFTAYELPFHAIDYCLESADIELSDVAHVAYSFDPSIVTGPLSGQESIVLPLEPSRGTDPEVDGSPWEPLFISHVLNAPRHLTGGYPHHLQRRFLRAAHNPSYKWRFLDHHLCHAASAFLPSAFQDSAVMTIDGRGEKATTSYWIGSGTALDCLGRVEYPHSLGLLYERITEHLGFLHSSDEYKVMALASFGRPTFVRELRRVVHVGKNGQYRIGRLELEDIGPRRRRGQAFEQWHFDLAHSVQSVLEETVLDLAGWLRNVSGCENLCMAGGVALNCVLNSRIRDAGLFENVWIQPAAGDAGTALGAALLADSDERGETDRRFLMDTAYLGPEYDDHHIEALLRTSGLRHRRSPDPAGDVAAHLAADKVVAWFQGRMEFGPRALGARSILASPINPEMQARLNEIKDREDFRPVAPVVLEEEAGGWFSPGGASPFMLFVHDLLPSQGDRIPAVVHVDGSARIQTINRRQNALYYDLIRAFKELTGVPVLVNTSFNTRGKPIVCTPRDAVECFMTSPIDLLALGPFLLEK